MKMKKERVTTTLMKRYRYRHTFLEANITYIINFYCYIKDEEEENGVDNNEKA